MAVLRILAEVVDLDERDSVGTVSAANSSPHCRRKGEEIYCVLFFLFFFLAEFVPRLISVSRRGEPGVAGEKRWPRAALLPEDGNSANHGLRW